MQVNPAELLRLNGITYIRNYDDSWSPLSHGTCTVCVRVNVYSPTAKSYNCKQHRETK